MGKIQVLGYFDHDYDWSQEEKEGETKEGGESANGGGQKRKHHSQFYKNGTECDLTGQYRKAEVKVRKGRSSIRRAKERFSPTFIPVHLRS